MLYSTTQGIVKKKKREPTETFPVGAAGVFHRAPEEQAPARFEFKIAAQISPKNGATLSFLLGTRVRATLPAALPPMGTENAIPIGN
jgi:hypothetical protein